jgi:hypothetical protein
MDRLMKRHLDRSRAVLSRDAVERPLYFVFASTRPDLYSNSKTANSLALPLLAAVNPQTTLKTSSRTDNNPKIRNLPPQNILPNPGIVVILNPLE